MDQGKDERRRGVMVSTKKEQMRKYPETVLQTIKPYELDTEMQDLVGKTLIFYDEHHGTARQLANAQRDDIDRLVDEYTVVIVLD